MAKVRVSCRGIDSENVDGRVTAEHAEKGVAICTADGDQCNALLIELLDGQTIVVVLK